MATSSLEELEQVLAAFYGAQSQDVRARAEAALSRFKSEPGTWHAALTCLRESSIITPAAQFFCLTVIRDKVRHHWAGISPYDRALLRSELMQALLALYSGLLQHSRGNLRPVANKAAGVLAQIALVETVQDLYSQHVGQLLVWLESPEPHIYQAGIQALLVTFEDFASTTRDNWGKVLSTQIPCIRRRLHSLLPALLEAVAARVITCAQRIENEAGEAALGALTLSLSSLHQLWAGMHQYGGAVRTDKCSKELIECLLRVAAKDWPACYADQSNTKLAVEAFSCVEDLILLLSSQLLGQQRDLLGHLLQLFQMLCERLLHASAVLHQEVVHPMAVLVRPILSLFRLHFRRLQSSQDLQQQLARLLEALGHLAASIRDFKASLVAREAWQTLLDNLLQAQMLAEDAVDVDAALTAWTKEAEVYKGAALQIADIVLNSLSAAPSGEQAASALSVLSSAAGSGEPLLEVLHTLSALQDDEGAAVADENEDAEPASEADVYIQASVSLLGLTQTIYPREATARFLSFFEAAYSRATAAGASSSGGRNSAMRELDVALILIAKSASDLPAASEQNAKSLRLVERLLQLALGSNSDTMTAAFRALSSVAAGWLPAFLSQAGDSQSAFDLVLGYWQAAAPVFIHAAQHGSTSLPPALLRAAGSALLALTSSGLFCQPSPRLLQELLQLPQVQELSGVAARLLNDASETVDSGTLGLWVALSDMHLRLPLDSADLPAREAGLGALLGPLVTAIEAGGQSTAEDVAQDTGKAAAVLAQIVGTYRSSNTPVRKVLYDNSIAAAMAATVRSLRAFTSQAPSAATEAATVQLLHLLTVVVDVLQAQIGGHHLSEMLGHVIDTFRAPGGTRVLFGGEAFRALLRIVTLAADGSRSLLLLSSSLQLCDALWDAPQEVAEDQLAVHAATASALLTVLSARWKDLRSKVAAAAGLGGSVAQVFARLVQVLREASASSIQPEDARCLLEDLQEALFVTAIFAEHGDQYTAARGPLMAALCDVLVSQRLCAHQEALLDILYSVAAADNLAFFRSEFLRAYAAQLPGVSAEQQQELVERTASAAYDASSFNEAVLGFASDVTWYQSAHIR